MALASMLKHNRIRQLFRLNDDEYIPTRGNILEFNNTFPTLIILQDREIDDYFMGSWKQQKRKDYRALYASKGV